MQPHKIVKISCEGSTTAWPDHRNPMIFKFLPGRGNIWKNCQFFWNDKSITKADYWVVIGDVDLEEEYCDVPRCNVILMTGEPPSIKRYDDSKEFAEQFGRVFTSQHDFKYSKVFPCRPPLNWWVDSGSPIKSHEEFDRWQGDGLSYDEFKKLTEVKKNKLLSVFCSSKVFTEGHKARFNFCKKLKEHFKDKIDWFGNGVRPLESKWDGIAPYKYHVSLENSNGPDYWTEKLMDPLLTLTHPIYCGASNIEKYFSKNQITVIDVKYPQLAIAKIERLISDNFYEKNLQNAIQARDLAMDKYNLFNLIAEIVDSDEKLHQPKSGLIKIKKERFFLSQNYLVGIKNRRGFIERVARSIKKKIVSVENSLTDHFLTLKFKLNK